MPPRGCGCVLGLCCSHRGWGQSPASTQHRSLPFPWMFSPLFFPQMLHMGVFLQCVFAESLSGIAALPLSVHPWAPSDEGRVPEPLTPHPWCKQRCWGCSWPSPLPKSNTLMDTQHLKLSFLAGREDFKPRLCVGVAQGVPDGKAMSASGGQGGCGGSGSPAPASARLSLWDVDAFTGSGLSEPSPGAAGAPGNGGGRDVSFLKDFPAGPGDVLSQHRAGI